MGVHSHVIPSFEWGLEAGGGAVVHIKARKRGRRVKSVEAAHSIRASYCCVSWAEGGGKGQGGVHFHAPYANKGATPLRFVHLSCSHMRGAEEGKKVEGVHLSELPAHSILGSCLQILFSQELGPGEKGEGGMPVRCAEPITHFIAEMFQVQLCKRMRAEQFKFYLYLANVESSRSIATLVFESLAQSKAIEWE